MISATQEWLQFLKAFEKIFKFRKVNVKKKAMPISRTAKTYPILNQNG